MTPLKKLLKRARAHPRIAAACLVLALLAGATLALHRQATQEANARKSPEALRMEQRPDDWLARPQNVSEFRQALDAGALSLVGLANGRPDLVLYTLKTGEKASSTVPGCTASGCAGTILDKLGDKSAQAGFALVSVDIDPRTTSQRLLDVINNLVSPLILVSALIGALFVGVKLQAGVGGAASRLSTRPQTQFADAIGNDEAKAALNRV